MNYLNGEYPTISALQARPLPTGRQEGVQRKGNIMPEGLALWGVEL